MTGLYGYGMVWMTVVEKSRAGQLIEDRNREEEKENENEKVKMTEYTPLRSIEVTTVLPLPILK